MRVYLESRHHHRVSEAARGQSSCHQRQAWMVIARAGAAAVGAGVLAEKKARCVMALG